MDSKNGVICSYSSSSTSGMLGFCLSFRNMMPAMLLSHLGEWSNREILDISLGHGFFMVASGSINCLNMSYLQISSASMHADLIRHHFSFCFIGLNPVAIHPGCLSQQTLQGSIWSWVRWLFNHLRSHDCCHRSTQWIQGWHSALCWIFHNKARLVCAAAASTEEDLGSTLNNKLQLMKLIQPSKPFNSSLCWKLLWLGWISINPG